MKGKRLTVDEYLNNYDGEVKNRLKRIRSIVKLVVPEAVEGFGYGVPGFKLNGKPLVYYAAFKNHIGLYPTPEVIEKFAKELVGYKTSKGAIQFPLGVDLPEELIKKIISYRAGMCKSW